MTERQWTALNRMANATNGDRWDYRGWTSYGGKNTFVDFTISRRTAGTTEAFEVRDREGEGMWYLFEIDNLNEFKGASNFLRLAYKVYSDKFLYVACATP